LAAVLSRVLREGGVVFGEVAAFSAEDCRRHLPFRHSVPEAFTCHLSPISVVAGMTPGSGRLIQFPPLWNGWKTKNRFSKTSVVAGFLPDFSD